MSQTNSNASNVQPNASAAILPGFGTPTPSTAGVSPAASLGVTTGIPTILSGLNANTIGLDGNTQNGDYATAVVASNSATPATVATAAIQTAALFTNVAAAAHFLPTNGLTVTSGEFNAAGAAGNYRTAASWVTTPKLAGNASVFTLTDTADSGKTFTLAENINGSPFTTGNGAVSEAFTFTGNNSDTLVVKHNVAVANVPATTNNNTGSALDVRNETRAETYTNTKASVTSNYGLNTAHKYAEANGNQTLNDARAEAFAYKDAGLTINSSVKTAVADAAYINGVEKIVENNVANYHYASTVASTAGTIDYVVTDARNLAQADQRTYTNITATNVAQFKVVDKTVAANPLTVEASGVITGTTTNLSTPVTIGGVTQQTTTFAPTNAKFTVNNSNYSLAVDAGQFTKNALNQNVFDNVLGLGNGGTLTGLGNGGTLFAPISGVTNQPVVPAALASAKYFVGTTFTGTDFADVIKVTDTATAKFNAKINAGAGNDTITGGFGDDVLTGGVGADSFVVNAGNDTITDFALGSDSLTVAKGTSTAKVTLSDGTVYNVTANAATDVIISALNADKTPLTKADLEKISGVAPDTINWTGTAFADTKLGTAGNDTLNGAGGNDTLNGATGNDILNGGVGADQLTGGAGADTFKFSDYTGTTRQIANRVDTITDFSVAQGDKIDLTGMGFTSFSGAYAVDAAPRGTLGFTNATATTPATLSGLVLDSTGTHELSIILTGVTAADLSAAAFIF